MWYHESEKLDCLLVFFASFNPNIDFCKVNETIYVRTTDNFPKKSHKEIYYDMSRIHRDKQTQKITQKLNQVYENNFIFSDGFWSLHQQKWLHTPNVNKKKLSFYLLVKYAVYFKVDDWGGNWMHVVLALSRRLKDRYLWLKLFWNLKDLRWKWRET